MFIRCTSSDITPWYSTFPRLGYPPTSPYYEQNFPLDQVLSISVVHCPIDILFKMIGCCESIDSRAPFAPFPFYKPKQILSGTFL